jgi:glycosyltransferase involved in cell wall biosynthesis
VQIVLRFLARHSTSDLEMLMSSGFFDVKWYLKENPDVHKAGVDPAAHYLQHGGGEGRDPGPLFDTEWYWWQNPGVQQVGTNPLLHFLHRRDVHNGRDTRRRQWRKNERSASSPAGSMLGWAPHYNLTAARVVKLKVQSVPNKLASNLRSPLNIVFVNHATFNNNSAGHITGFANVLAERGHNVVVCARGNPKTVNDFGVPKFHMVSRAGLMSKPQILRDIFAESFDRPTLIHCWSAREIVRVTAIPAIQKFQIPYFVHFEDNDEAITRAELGLTAEEAKQLSSRDWDERLPSGLSHPVRASSFVSEAAGITIIVDALRQLIPSGIPFHLLQPGLDLALLTSPIDRVGRSLLCHKFNIPLGACIISYTGNVHRANARDMLKFYAAIQEINSRGISAHLIRTGSNFCPELEDEFKGLAANHVSELGCVDRPTLMEVFSLAEIFVQPGHAGEFDDYRLPAKLPDLLASGRPVILPATNVGLRLRDYVDCLLLHHGEVTEIADRIAVLARDRVLADWLGSNARRFAIENFNWERNASRLERFYSETLMARSS